MIVSKQTLEKIGFEQIRISTLKRIYTPMGREWVERLSPLSIEHALHERLKQGQEILRLGQNGEHLPFHQVEDIRSALEHAHAEGAMLSIQAIHNVREHAALARVMKEFILRRKEQMETCQHFVSGLFELKEIEKAISQAISDYGEVKDDASKELKSIRSSLRRTRQSLRSTADQLLRRYRKEQMAPEEGATIRDGRLVIPLLVEHKRKINGMLHDLSATGKTAYVEPSEMVELNNDIRSLEIQETREIERILRELTAFIQRVKPELYSNSETLGWIDGIQAVVRTGISWNGNYPMQSTDGHLQLKKARNPVLIHHLKADKVVALDLDLLPEERGLVITGPNAGGKSVAMKTTGLLNLLFQCGYPLPVDADSVLPVLSGLFVDIGDEQSIENDLSTFSSRLNWMKTTLDQIARIPMGEQVLVLIDEAGTGTDPEEGGALFQAFIEECLNRPQSVRVIVTTHHGSLKVFAHTSEGIVNGAMEFDQEHLEPTYKFRKGVPGSSYAFEIATRMKVPDSVLRRSKEIIGTHSDKMGQLLLDLEKRLSETEQARKTYDEVRSKAEKSQQEYEARASELRREKAKKLEEAYLEAERILKSANQRIEQAVETIVQQGRIDRTQIKEARNVVEREKQQIAQKKNRVRAAVDSLPQIRKEDLPPIGSMIGLEGSASEGELVEVEGQHAVLLMNGLRIKTPLHKLRLLTSVPGEKKRKSNSKKNVGIDSKKKGGAGSTKKGHGNMSTLKQNSGLPQSFLDQRVSMNLDLRGKRGDAAIKELTHYLDQALSKGLPKVEIIHGTGEGILMKLVGEYLSKRKGVKHFESAPYDQGGPGKTIVTLE